MCRGKLRFLAMATRNALIVLCAAYVVCTLAIPEPTVAPARACSWPEMTKLCGDTRRAPKGQCIACVLQHAALGTCQAQIEGFCSGGAAPRGAPASSGPRPSTFEPARVARWLVHQNTWGTIATISNAHDSGSNGTAWANPQSFSDGIYNSSNPQQQSTGIPYFFMTGLDETPQDLKLNPRGAFSISESQISGDPTCQKTDTEDPTCARIR